MYSYICTCTMYVCMRLSLCPIVHVHVKCFVNSSTACISLTSHYSVPMVIMIECCELLGAQSSGEVEWRGREGGREGGRKGHFLEHSWVKAIFDIMIAI